MCRYGWDAKPYEGCHNENSININKEVCATDICDEWEAWPVDPAPILNPDYWDCECDDYYIHSKDADKCEMCGAVRDEMPDSHQSEIEAGMHLAERMG